MKSSDVILEITASDLLDFPPRVPMPVAVRVRLNAAGFKFEGDGKVSAIIDTEPKPIGLLVFDRNIEANSITFRQWFNVPTPAKGDR